MGVPTSPPFNPSVSSVPVLGPSSGDPRAKNDPKSPASIGANIQALKDQSNADRLYDAPVTQVSEGFESYNSVSYMPWIVRSQACRRVQGFIDMAEYKSLPKTDYLKILTGVGMLILIVSFICRD